MPIVIQPLIPGLLAEWLNFFDNVAFADNPEWADCYCCCYQLNCTIEEWNKKTKEQNRLSAQEFIKSGKMKGYLAFENSSPVGWCNVNDFSSFHGISSSDEIASLNRKGKTAAIICFIIGSNHRGKGIARMLLKQAISDLKVQEYDSLEAYPRLGENLSQAAQFHGPLQLYLNEGFEIKKSYEKYAVVNYNLK